MDPLEVAAPAAQKGLGGHRPDCACRPCKRARGEGVKAPKPKRKVQKHHGKMIAGKGIEGHRPDCACYPCKHARGEGAAKKRRAGFVLSVDLLARLERVSKASDPHMSQSKIVESGIAAKLDEMEKPNVTPQVRKR